MLDSKTKRTIDNMCDILVAKFPIPQDQVDQITVALIYKFMSDMDKESVEVFKGKKSFLIGEYEKYSWDNLSDTKNTGVERLKLYKEGIESMPFNRNLPKLFRDIFKNANTPLDDPRIFNDFFKDVSEFEYSNSETLGTAYEYLLSKTGAQGKLGQFRTPRHIIDFIVDTIKPTKTDAILDPACGTAGFLISSYKHILNQSSESGTKKMLTSDEVINLGNNLVGYDIEPKMVRTSQVNMYLHDFKTPQIHEYDCLSSDSKWNEFFDVIVANPPFFSPKGGITPHNQFRLSSKRAEVLFADYILSHLKPNGRAAIIVPEGINFNKTKQYKNLRRYLLDEGLVADITLPHGVFKPYADVKTHILFIDRRVAKDFKDILFIEIENDGFTQTDTRKPVDGEQLSEARKLIEKYLNNGKEYKGTENPKSYKVSKETIDENQINHLMGRWYDYENSNRLPPSVTSMSIGEICSIKQGLSPNEKTLPGDFTLVVPAPNLKTADHFDFETKGVCIPKVSSAGHGKAEIQRLHYIHGKFALADTMILLSSKNEEMLDNKYLYHLLSAKKDDLLLPLMKGASNVSLESDLLLETVIPVPNIDSQKELVKELDSYNAIISSVKDIKSNYIPKLDVNADWESYKLEDICELNQKSVEPKKQFKDNFIYIDLSAVEARTGNIDLSQVLSVDSYPVRAKRLIKEKDILFCGVRPYTQSFGYVDFETSNVVVSTGITVISVDESKILSKFLYFYLFSNDFMEQAVTWMKGEDSPSINNTDLKKIEIKFPSLDEQQKIVDVIEHEQKLINKNLELEAINEQKIKKKIEGLWGTK